ncbi:MAG: class IV adenylate cyclase [Ignavibacteriales bacterium]|nr:class IV adenylate cyclase [Ignavibacteriales bacterium]
MPVNLEIKAHVNDLQVAENIAIEIGAHETGVLIQTDTYFNSPNGRLKMREVPDSDAELIFYNREEDSVQRRSNFYIYKTINASDLKEILASSYGIRAVVEKKRKLYMLGTTRIHIDQVKDLGSFLEFEIPMGDNNQTPSGIMNYLIDRFNISHDQFITKSYIDLMLLNKEQVF